MATKANGRRVPRTVQEAMALGYEEQGAELTEGFLSPNVIVRTGKADLVADSGARLQCPFRGVITYGKPLAA